MPPGAALSSASTDAAWQAFLAEEIAPRFPDGLTVLNAAGQWRDASSTMVREHTKVVLILTKPGDAGVQRTVEIADVYNAPSVRSPFYG